MYRFTCRLTQHLPIPIINKKMSKDTNRRESATETLWEALGTDDAEAVKKALADGADVNAKDKYGDTPLRDAAKNGHAETCRQLLRQHGGK